MAFASVRTRTLDHLETSARELARLHGFDCSHRQWRQSSVQLAQLRLVSKHLRWLSVTFGQSSHLSAHVNEFLHSLPPSVETLSIQLHRAHDDARPCHDPTRLWAIPRVTGLLRLCITMLEGFVSGDMYLIDSIIQTVQRVAPRLHTINLVGGTARDAYQVVQSGVPCVGIHCGIEHMPSILTQPAPHLRRLLLSPDPVYYTADYHRAVEVLQNDGLVPRLSAVVRWNDYERALFQGTELHCMDYAFQSICCEPLCPTATEAVDHHLVETLRRRKRQYLREPWWQAACVRLACHRAAPSHSLVDSIGDLLPDILAMARLHEDYLAPSMPHPSTVGETRVLVHDLFIGLDPIDCAVPRLPAAAVRAWSSQLSQSRFGRAIVLKRL